MEEVCGLQGETILKKLTSFGHIPQKNIGFVAMNAKFQGENVFIELLNENIGVEVFFLSCSRSIKETEKANLDGYLEKYPN